MTARYVYEHPAEAGFGEHHAERDSLLLTERSADRHGVAGAPQHPALPGEATMADLDLKHGTTVTRADPDGDRDLEVVEWTDSQGTPRRTSLTPEFFGEHFRKVNQ